MATLKVRIGTEWVQDDCLYQSEAAALQDGLQRGFDPSELQTEKAD